MYVTVLAPVLSTFSSVVTLFFTLLLASIPLYLLFEREHRHRLRLDESLKNLQQRVVVIHDLYQSLQSNTAVPTHLDDRVICYSIMAKKPPIIRGR